MPDQYGMPSGDDIANKLKTAAPAGMTDALEDDIPSVLAAVIAEFQGPIGSDGRGGTGRSFQPTLRSHYYDGTGFPELKVHDFDPTQPWSVSLYETPLIDVQAKDPDGDLPITNIVYRPQLVGGTYLTGFIQPAVFPLGKQNLVMQAYFGIRVTPDVFEAIRCETCYRLLVQNEVGIDGFGEVIKIGSFQFDTSVGSSQFEETSSLSVMHTVYERCIMRWRDNQAWKWKRQVRRMS